MKCLIVDQMHEITPTLLEGQGISATYNPEITRSEMLKILSDYDGLIIRSKTPVDRELIEAAPKLKFVGRAGAGVDNLDVDLLQEKGIEIINAPEGNRNALAEHAMGLLLALMHNIVKADSEVREYRWDREGNRGVELAGKTVGLIGYGFMGQAFAKKLKAFGCRVIAYDKYKTNFSDEYCDEVSLDEIFSKSEIFSIHVPLTAETRQMVNNEFLQQFDHPIYLLNTSRGEVLSLEACSKALQSGKVKAIALDVLENEKIDRFTPEQKRHFDFLRQSSRVVITPHVAGWSIESYEQISRVLASKIGEFLTKIN